MISNNASDVVAVADVAVDGNVAKKKHRLNKHSATDKHRMWIL